jgi:hypothetical protein
MMRKKENVCMYVCVERLPKDLAEHSQNEDK